MNLYVEKLRQEYSDTRATSRTRLVPFFASEKTGFLSKEDAREVGAWLSLSNSRIAGVRRVLRCTLSAGRVSVAPPTKTFGEIRQDVRNFGRLVEIKTLGDIVAFYFE